MEVSIFISLFNFSVNMAELLINIWNPQFNSSPQILKMALEGQKYNFFKEYLHIIFNHDLHTF